MTFPDFLDFVVLVETKINHFDSLISNHHNEPQKSFMIRCYGDKETVISKLGTLSRVESSPQLCLTVAIGSYLFQLNQVFLLNLPSKLQEWLSCDSFLWIQGKPEHRNNIDRYLMDQTSDWQQWVSRPPKNWSTALSQKLEREVNSAHERVQKFMHT